MNNKSDSGSLQHEQNNCGTCKNQCVPLLCECPCHQSHREAPKPSVFDEFEKYGGTVTIKKPKPEPMEWEAGFDEATKSLFDEIGLSQTWRGSLKAYIHQLLTSERKREAELCIEEVILLIKVCNDDALSESEREHGRAIIEVIKQHLP